MPGKDDGKIISQEWKCARPNKIKKDLKEIGNDPNISPSDKAAIIEVVTSEMLEKDEEEKFNKGIFAKNDDNEDSKIRQENTTEKNADTTKIMKILDRLKNSKIGTRTKRSVENLKKLI